MSGPALSGYKLRDYQIEALRAAEAAFQTGCYTGVYVIFTGGGKTLISAESIRRFAPPTSYRTLFVGGVSRTLVNQSQRELSKFLPEFNKYLQVGTHMYPGFGVVMGSIDQCNARVICASIQTLVDKTDSIDKKAPESAPIEKSDVYVDEYGNIHLAGSRRSFLVSKRFDRILANGGPIHLWIHDEAHHAVADGSLALLTRLKQLYEVLGLPPLKVLGNTATPIREDGRGLQNIFERVLVDKSLLYAQEHGYAVPFAEPITVSAFSASIHDDNDLGFESVTKVENWADIIVETYKAKAQGRYAIAYTGAIGDLSAVEASKLLARKFNQAGIKAAHIDGKDSIGPDGKTDDSEQTAKEKRGQLLNAFQQGDIKVLCNYGVLIEGIDLPRCDCILLARKVNATTFTQIIGRAIRLFPSKEDMLLIDFTGQKLVLSTLSSILGYQINPFTQALEIDPIIIEAIKFLKSYLETNSEQLLEWIQQSQLKNTSAVLDVIKRIPVLAQDLKALNKADISIIKSLYFAITENDKDLDGGIRSLRESLNAYGKKTRFETAKISTNSKFDWDIDPETLLMTLTVNANMGLVINQPNYVTIDKLRQLEEREDASENNPLLGKAIDYFSNFILWCVEHEYDTTKGKIIAYRDNLIDLERYAEEYLASLGERVVSAFSKKRVSWKNKKEPATDKQKAKLRALKVSFHESIDKKEASRLISRKIYTGFVSQQNANLLRRLLGEKA